MKKVIALLFAAVMMLSVMAVAVSAADTKVMLEIGPDVFTLTDSEMVDVPASGTYTFTATSGAPINGSGIGTFIGVKVTQGNVAQPTAIPDGTTFTVKSVKFDGNEVAVNADKATYTIKNGNLDFILKLLDFGYSENIFAEDLPSFNTVEVVVDVVYAGSEAPADEAPADEAPADTAPADEAPADTAPADEAPAEAAPETPTAAPSTGLALAAVPAVIAMAAAFISKKH